MTTVTSAAEITNMFSILIFVILIVLVSGIAQKLALITNQFISNKPKQSKKR
jgi:hypothetical protein